MVQLQMRIVLRSRTQGRKLSFGVGVGVRMVYTPDVRLMDGSYS
jgi:hypothetical protein